MRLIAVICALVVLGGVLPTRLVATVISPAGLAPGSQYQLIFVTIDTTTATSSNIDDYNSFVAIEAAFGTSFGLPAGVTWHAVASTSSVDAKDNAPLDHLPVFNTNGQLVASSSIYSGALLSAVLYDETGTPAAQHAEIVWTGSDPLGVGIPGLTLGATGGMGVEGLAPDPNSTWMNFTATFPDLLTSNAALYALSDPITVPLPEPATLTLLSVALAAFGGRRLLRQRTT